MWLAYFLTLYIPFVAIVCYWGQVGQVSQKRVSCSVGIKRYPRDYVFLIFAYLPLVIMACFRSENTGNDTRIYISIFNEIKEALDYSSFIFNTRFEPGFVVYNKFLASTFGTPQSLLIISSFFILFSIIRAIWKYSISIWLSVFMFFCINFNSTMVVMRQYIAVGILLFSFDFVVKRKPIPFLLLWLLACTFHFTAVIFGLVYFAYKIKINKKTLSLLVLLLPITIIVSFVFLEPFLNFFHDEGYYGYYNSKSKYIAEGIKIASFAQLFLGGLILLISTKAFKALKTRNVLNNNYVNKIIYICCICGFFIVAMSLPFNLLSRLALYFSIFNCILVPNAIHEYTKRGNDNLANCLRLFIVILYGMNYIVVNVYRPEWTNIYPYEFYK